MADDQLPNTPVGSATIIQQTPPPWAVGGAAAHDNTGAGAERYELLDELARGGMGVVYRARDRVLDREVGLKTLLHVSTEGSVIASRFREEARITAQLQHPNIPPVHDLGTLPDGRPFLAMKLIKGKTLAALLGDRTDPAADRGRFLAIFEHIAQGLAYAHAHKVIHRDLKPANVMVGNFGEVQVMDWGLAKVLADGGRGTDPVPEIQIHSTTEVQASRDAGNETRPGSIFGTPAYMSREQAIGAIDQIDERSDVFGLGGILCIILTGNPPYVGKNAESTRQLAAVAHLDDALVGLDACGAEPDLIALCKRCLSSEKADRPRDAAQVAQAVAELRAEAERRARRAEVDRVRAEGDRAKAEVHVAEQRKRRKVQFALFGALVLLAAGVGTFAWWRDKQELAAERAEGERLRIEGDQKAAEARADAEEGFKVQQARRGATENLALATTLRKQFRFEEAATALALASELANSGARELLPTVEQAQRDLAFVVRLDNIRYRKWAWIAEAGGKGRISTAVAAPEYQKAFEDRELNLMALEPARAAELIAASGIKVELVAAVDDWARCEQNPQPRAHLLEIARRAAPGPWTDRLRDPATWRDIVAVKRLAADADPATAPVAALIVLAELIAGHGLDPSPFLSAARAKHPADFELAFALGLWHTQHGKNGSLIGPYEAARALRPKHPTVWNNLGGALMESGDVGGAILVFKEAIRLEPRDPCAHNNLGVALKQNRDVDGAIAAFRDAIRLDPQCAVAHNNLGVVLAEMGDLEGAYAAYKEAVRCDPKLAMAHNNLGNALEDKGQLEDALAAYREAIKHNPAYAKAHTNLGIALRKKGDLKGAISASRDAIRYDPKLHHAHFNLGSALRESGDLDGAISAYKDTIKHNPDFAPGYFQLAVALRAKSDFPGAIGAYKEAIKRAPADAPTHNNLGSVLLDTGDIDGAVSSYQEAIKHDSKYAPAHNNLGNALRRKGDIGGAVAAYKEAIRHKPDYAQAHYNLGLALAENRDVDGAIAAWKESLKYAPQRGWTHYNLGLAFDMKDEAASAIAAYQQAIKHDPNLVLAHNNLGVLYLNQQKYAEAIVCARAAVKADPQFASGHALLGKLLQLTGDISGARAAYTEAARLDKKWVPVLAKLPTLSIAPPPRELKCP